MAIPRERSLDSTLALLREGYPFIASRCRRYRSELFATRLMLRRVTCMSGEEAARVFYAPDRFTRNGAIPPTTLRLLQDRGSVALLDGEPHRRRKHLFLGLMSPGRVAELGDLVRDEWRAAMAGWAGRERVVLHDEVEIILCRAVCAWAGVPLAPAEAARRAGELAAMIDGAGGIGPRLWRGLLLRRRTEHWARGLIGRIRAGDLAVPEGSVVGRLAAFREADGALLDETEAAVELINILRPTVAIAWYITFAALALHDHPEWRDRLAADDADLTPFAQEVRRFYPFFPFVGGRVRSPFDWRGVHFARGDWVLLDLYGTLHDPRLWEEPDAFRPARFRAWAGHPFTLIPQGGGEHATGHRCPGESITVALIVEALRLLTREMRYTLPPQDLTVDLRRFPTLPRSRVVITGVVPVTSGRGAV